MNALLLLLLLISLAFNGILIWYTRKLVQNMYYGISNIDELQKLLNEYASLLEPLSTMENYYGDPALASAIANTKLVIDACRIYKKTIIEDYNEENQEIQEDQEGQSNQKGSQEGYQDQKTGTKESRRKAEATIGPISTNLS
jgi:hypothetical protein